MITGRVDSSREALEVSPSTMRARYDNVIHDKTKRIQEYKQAVAGLMAQRENRVIKLADITKDVERLERMKAGALAKAKKTIDQSKNPDNLRDENYKKCLAAFNDFSSTLKSKQTRISELEGDIEESNDRIDDHKKRLIILRDEIDELRDESKEAVADIITTQQEKDLNDTLAGIAQDGTARELQRLRQIRQEIQTNAKISKELSGENANANELEFLKYANETTRNNEFDLLLGLPIDDAEIVDAQPASA